MNLIPSLLSKAATIGIALAMLLVLACGSDPTPTPEPTATPAPTATHRTDAYANAPTATPRAYGHAGSGADGYSNSGRPLPHPKGREWCPGLG